MGQDMMKHDGSVKLYPNGFILYDMRESKYWVNHKHYCGVERCFPWIDCEDDEGDEYKQLKHYIDEEIKIWWDNTFVEACADWDFIQRCMKYCNEHDIPVDILYCMTECKCHEVKAIPEVVADDFTFIGYDYAYPGGSFYSCILSDIGRIEELDHTPTNEYGLIPTEEDMVTFIKERHKIEKISEPMRFELGDFIIYKLWLYEPKDRRKDENH